MDRIGPDMRPALVIVDMQERFRGDYADTAADWDLPVSVINRMADSFRRAGRPVILLRMEGPCLCHPWGGPETDVFIPELHRAESDIIITKAHMSGFRDTELASTLRGLDCNSLILCGTVTNLCVMNTYFSAFDNDFIPYLLKDGTIGTKEGVNQAAQIVCSCVPVGHVEEYIGL